MEEQEEKAQYSEEYKDWAESEHMAALILNIRESQENTLLKAMRSEDPVKLTSMALGMESILLHLEGIHEH